MKTTNTLILIALSTLILSSCTMEKRLYNKGFHVSWNKKYKTANSQDEKNEVYASERDENRSENKVESPVQSADVSLNDDALVSVDVSSERESDFTETVAAIHNSETNNATPQIEEKAQEKTTSRQSVKQKKQKAKAKTAADGSESGGSSQVVALILVILVGVLGIHRFYLGHIGIGILMLLTCGVCGILALVDLIRIITGDLKPKYGEYTETL